MEISRPVAHLANAFKVFAMALCLQVRHLCAPEKARMSDGAIHGDSRFHSHAQRGPHLASGRDDERFVLASRLL